MTYVTSIVIIAVLAFGGYVAALNWMSLFTNLRNRRRGIDRHVSPVPLIAQLAGYVALVVSRFAEITWIPTTTFLTVALADFSIWQLVSWPAVVLWHRVRRLLRNFGRAE